MEEKEPDRKTKKWIFILFGIIAVLNKEESRKHAIIALVVSLIAFAIWIVPIFS